MLAAGCGLRVQQGLCRTMEQAFKDLRALMARAQEMVALAQRFRERSAGERADDEAMDAEMESELISLGIASPVTRSTAGALYHQQLSRQVHTQSPHRRSRHIKLWCDSGQAGPGRSDGVRQIKARAGCLASSPSLRLMSCR